MDWPPLCMPARVEQAIRAADSIDNPLTAFGKTAAQAIDYGLGAESLTKSPCFIDFIDKRAGRAIGHSLDKVYGGSLDILPPLY